MTLWSKIPHIFGSTWRCNKALFQASEWYWYIGKSWECTKVAAIVNCTWLYGCMVERGMHCKLFLNIHLFDVFRPGLLALWMTCIEFCLSAHLILLCVDLGNLIWISSIHIMNWHRTKNRIWFQESAGSATSSWSLQKCQPQLIRDSTWPRSVWKSTHFRPGGDCNRWGGENDGKIDGKMMVCLKHTLKSLKPTKVFGSTSRVLFDFLGKSAMDKPHPRISTTCQISDFKV